MQRAQVLQYIHNGIKSNAYGERLRLLLVFSSLPKITSSPVIFLRSVRGCEADLQSFLESDPKEVKLIPEQHLHSQELNFHPYY